MIMMIVTAPTRLMMMIKSNKTVSTKANDDLNTEMDAKYVPCTQEGLHPK
jgi:hypothetical protein